MSKVVLVTSLRNGVGRTTVACLLGLKLAETGFKTLIIDNNYKFCDVAHYLMVKPEYTVDDLKPFMKTLEKSTIKSMIVTVEKNLDILSGSTMSFVNNTLGKEDIKKINVVLNDEYDYIIIDNRAGIEHEETLKMADIVDYGIIVMHPSNYEYTHYQNLAKTLEKEKIDKLNTIISKSYLIYNRYIDTASIDLTNAKKVFPEDRILMLGYCDKLIDFCNGFKCQLKSEVEKELETLVNSITNKTIEKKSKKLAIGEKIKSLLSTF
jgi:MinD-like ATPase involved in chromosome partitioning or flagellar assembly